MKIHMIASCQDPGMQKRFTWTFHDLLVLLLVAQLVNSIYKYKAIQSALTTLTQQHGRLKDC